MASCAPAKRPTPAPPTKKHAKTHGNAGGACSHSDCQRFVAIQRAERLRDSAAINDLASHDGGHGCSPKRAAVERRVARTAGRSRRMVGPCVIERENR